MARFTRIEAALEIISKHKNNQVKYNELQKGHQLVGNCFIVW